MMVLPKSGRHSDGRRHQHSHEDRSARSDPQSFEGFEGVWCEVLSWLQKQPDVTATNLLNRLMRRYPERHSRRQLRTLQRRVCQWRGVVAEQLVYTSAEQSEGIEADRGVIGPVGVNQKLLKLR